MPIVNETLDLPGSSSPTVTVTVELVGSGGYPVEGFSGDTTIVGKLTPTVTTGAWSATLVANDLIVPAGTAYRRTVKGRGFGATDFFEVPNTAGPFVLEDILTEAPASIATSTYSALDARVTVLEDAPGGGGTAATTAFDDTGNTVVVGDDVQAALDAADVALTGVPGTYATASALATEVTNRGTGDTNAIATAASDATTKANAAQAAAVSAASTDATTKANAAQAAAISSAATDATTKVGIETAARIVDVDAEETARIAAVAAEATLARDADNLTTGTVADARIASTIARDSEVTSAVAGEASARDTAIGVAVAAEAVLARNADNLSSGTVADARIASTIARDSEVTAAVAAEATLARSGDNITSGTVADARIASTIARDSEVTTAVGIETSRATAAEALLAPLVSPPLTGTPTAPTAAQGTSTTQVATTAFVNAEIAADAYVTPDISRFAIYGHSLAYGSGITDPDRDVTTKLASLLKMRELPRAVAGAVLHFHQASATGDGGYAHLLQNEIRPVRYNNALTATTTAGVSTTITVGSTTGLFAGYLLHVGTGTNGEMLTITSVTSGTVLTVSRLDGTATVAASHSIGEPVYVVPSAYSAQTPLYLMWWGINDLAASPIGSQVTGIKERFIAPLRMAVARARCAEVYEDTHSSVTYAGTTSSGGSSATNSGTATPATARNFTAAASTATIQTPANFPGGTIDLGFLSGVVTAANAVLWSFTVDGVSAGTVSAPINYSGMFTGYVKRLTGLTAGRHTIVATLTTLGAGTNAFFDWWGIEAENPPLVVIPGLNRLPDATYAPYSAAPWSNRQGNTTLTGSHASGVSSFTVASTANMQVGASVTFEVGGGNAETREVATVPSGTTFTTTAVTGITHAGATTVRYGMQDADIALVNTHIQNLAAEFDSKVAYFDVDTIIAANIAYFYGDRLHFNDLGNAVLVDDLFEFIRPRFSLVTGSYTSTPTAPLPSAVNFATFAGSVPGTVGTGAWLNMPTALTELYGFAAHRKYADLRRCFEARFIVGVAAAGVTNARLRIQYSIDTGTTWKYLFRTAAYAEDTTHEANVSATGMKDSGWKPIAAEALADNVYLRVVGINGDGAGDPTFGTIDCYFR